ncbi:hypothetical protein [Nocardia alba]|nr:hypothetical protein [Nocardia alba]
MAVRFNPPPNWPVPPPGWKPPLGWQPGSELPPLPSNWTLWIPDDDGTDEELSVRAAVEFRFGLGVLTGLLLTVCATFSCYVALAAFTFQETIVHRDNGRTIAGYFNSVGYQPLKALIGPVFDRGGDNNEVAYAIATSVVAMIAALFAVLLVYRRRQIIGWATGFVLLVAMHYAIVVILLTAGQAGGGYQMANPSVWPIAGLILWSATAGVALSAYRAQAGDRPRR